ncbi:hypothetical protein [Rhizobium mesosinicum]|uniref:Uncharacterized protein n=1 Tax=Rhizobium mesosinicum TaxID=335017 RepID=A0ABS7H0I7_9HYPH|nr:hypothetical protein [Rhizobium mesosinicum]MBW9054879.1 hypothetical protein [Rhizobium mesosinicum]
MPTVPTYQDTQQHIALRPEYTEGFTVKADAEAFGSAIGKGMQGLATGMGALGNAVVQVEQLDNANSAKDRQTKFGDWSREALHGKDGFLTLTGRAAVEGRAAFEKLVEQKRSEFGKGLTPGAARTYEETSRASMNTLLDSTIRHTFDQRKVWFAETSANSIKSSADDAVAVYNDPAKVAAAIHKGVTEIEHQGRMQGWSKEKLVQESAQYVSDTTKKVVLQMANESPIKAEQYIKTAPGLLPTAKTELLKTLESAVTAEKARHNATDIITGLAPTYTGAPDPDTGTAPSPGAAQTRTTAANGKTPQAGSAGPATAVQSAEGRTKTSGLETREAGDKTAAPRLAGSTTVGYQTTASQATGFQIATPPATSRRPSGPEDFRTVASTIAFPGKTKDDVALAGFVKNAAGTSVDPSLKPWLSHVTGAILGTAAALTDPIRGAAADANSFGRFGLPTETPRAGDIVVLRAAPKGGTGNNGGKGNDDGGYFGFFRGYDADGNVIVLGSDPKHAGETVLSAHASSRVVGFRTSGTVDARTMALPNYNPDGLRMIEEGLGRITDPALRAATEAQLSGYVISQKKAIDATRFQAQEWANNQVISDPNFDPTKLPLRIRQALGPTGMTTLLDYKEKVRAYGQPTTDPHTLYDLQTQFATDPAAFARTDLFEFRAKLSDKDWEKINSWRQTALTDQRKAHLESLDLKTAFELARPQLEGLGLINPNPGFFSSSDAPRRAAQFQTMLVDQMDDFKTLNDGRNPTQSDVQKMINRLLLPIVISTPSHGRGLPPTTTSAGLFEANNQADDASYDITVQYEDIPRDLRMAIEADLTQSGKPKPTRKQIEDTYELFILNR